MSWSGALLLGGLLAAHGQADPEDDALLAVSALRAGRSHVAWGHAVRCLLAKPGSTPCARVRLLAAGRLGRCEHAFEDAALLRRRASWGPALAHAEGVCALRLGERARARVAFEEAVAQDEEAWASLGQLATLLVQDADPAALAALDALETAGQLDRALLARLAAGGAEATAERGLELHLADGLLPDRGGLRAGFQALLCEEWMALGDPMAAQRAAWSRPHALVLHSRLAACLAEATRREGAPGHALERLDQPWWQEVDAVALDAVRVRVLVDLGRGEEALALLATLPMAVDEVARSEAYAAWRAGAPADAAVETPAELRVLIPVRP